MSALEAIDSDHQYQMMLQRYRRRLLVKPTIEVPDLQAARDLVPMMPRHCTVHGSTNPLRVYVTMRRDPVG